jgi:hypothetical protein
MNKTQLLSDTENLFIAREKSQIIMKQEQVTWYSNDGTLVLEMENNGVFSMLHFGDTFTINTLLVHKHIKDIQI